MIKLIKSLWANKIGKRSIIVLSVVIIGVFSIWYMGLFNQEINLLC